MQIIRCCQQRGFGKVFSTNASVMLEKDMTRNAFILLGLPTSGKTTQAIFLEETTRAKRIRGRDILPDLVSKLESSREQIPDTQFVPALIKILQSVVSGQVIFDNIPRSVKQAECLLSWVSEQNATLCVINLKLTDAEVESRAKERSICSSCGEVFHRELKPSKIEGKCDNDGQVLVKRTGDDPKKIKSALEKQRRLLDEVVNSLPDSVKIYNISASGTVFETARRIFEQISHLIFYKPEMAAGYFKLRDALDKFEVPHLFFAGMPVFMYGGRALMKDFDILVPDEKIEQIATELGLKVGEKHSSVADTKFVDIAPGVEINSNLEVKVGDRQVNFGFQSLYQQAHKVRFMGLECAIMGLEDLIIFKAALGRFGHDDWGKHKDDLSDIEGMVGAQNVNWGNLKNRANESGLLDTVKDKLKAVNIQPQF